MARLRPDGSTESAPSVLGRPTIADHGSVPQYHCRRRFPSPLQKFRRRRRLLRRACSPTTPKKQKKIDSTSRLVTFGRSISGLSAMEVKAIGHRLPPSGSKTADSQAQSRTPQSPSYIPLFSPKTTRNPAISSNLPSSLSAPHLGLVPPNRTPSGSEPPQKAGGNPPPSPSSAHASGGTSLPSLRALRNFLPFSSAKPVSSTAVPGPSKNLFVGFTPGRRSSLTIDRKNSGQFPRSAGDNDVAVISIAPPSQPNPEPAQDNVVSADAQEPSFPSVSALHGELGTFDGTSARCTTCLAYLVLI